MVSQQIRNFFIERLQIDDIDVNNYLEYLIDNERIFEIEPFLDSEQFLDLINLIRKENEDDIIFDKRKPQFIEKELRMSGNVCQDERKIKIQKLEHSKLEIRYKMKRDLPVFKYQNELLEKIRNNRILLIEGSTGCGKSTQIPKFLLNHFKKIIVSQPRRIAASNLAKRVSNEIHDSLGNIVGYKVRFEEKASQSTRLKFVTDGILLQEKDEYDCIIIDEVHERKINSDVFFAILNKFKFSRLILMSATIDFHRFVTFFQCGLISIFQKQFEKEIIFLESSCYDHIKKIIETLRKIHSSKNKQNILIFLSGIHEINKCEDVIINEKFENVIIFKLHSSISFDIQQSVFKEYEKSKIILSTNIAETSITIEDLDVIIDSGYVKHKSFNNGIEELQTVNISKQQAEQRAGRVGRTKFGRVFRIYTKNEYDNFINENIPEIKNVNLCNLIIYLKKMNISNILQLKFLDLPPEANFRSCLEKLYRLEILDDAGKLTKRGHEISQLPLEPELSISLLKANELFVLREVSAICALLSTKNLFLYDQPTEYDKILKIYGDSSSDFIFLLNVYQDFQKNHVKWMKNKIINYKSFCEAQRIHIQIMSIFRTDCQKKEFPYSEIKKRISSSLCAGYFLNTAVKKKNEYFLFINDEQVYVHPSSIVFDKNHKYVLFHSLFMSNKPYAKICMILTQNELQNASSIFLKRQIKDELNN